MKPKTLSPRSPDAFKILMEIVNILSFSVEAFTRREFGERYVNWLRFLLSLLFLNSFLGFLRFFHSLPLVGGGVYPELSSYFWYSFIFLSCYHLFRIWRRNRQGIAWHSRSPGISHLSFLGINDAILFRFIEPMLCLAVSFILGPVSPLTSNWIFVSSLCLLIKNNVIFNNMRGKVLDVIDGRIEAAVIAGKLEGNDKRKTAGWSNVVAMPTDLDLGDETSDGEEIDADFEAVVAQMMDTTLSQNGERKTADDGTELLPAADQPSNDANEATS